MVFLQLRSNLYWTDVFNRTLHVADKLTGIHKQTSRGRIRSVMEIKAMAYDIQTGWTPCLVQNGGCTHLCFYKGYRHGYTCGCPDLPDITCQKGTSSSRVIKAQHNNMLWVTIHRNNIPVHWEFRIAIFLKINLEI